MTYLKMIKEVVKDSLKISFLYIVKMVGFLFIMFSAGRAIEIEGVDIWVFILFMVGFVIIDLTPSFLKRIWKSAKKGFDEIK